MDQWVLIAVFLFFALGSMALALLFLPGAREWAQLRLQRGLSAGSSATGAAATAGGRGLRTAGGRAAEAATTTQRWLSQQGAWIAGTLALMAAVPLAAWLLRSWVPLEGYDHTAAPAIDQRVLAALAGEQLVAPLPLPPEMFSTPDLERARPLIRFASREWALLDEAFRQRLLLVFKRMHDLHGYELVLLEGYRSPQRQAQLAALGTQVTQAGAWESFHQYGLAADVAFRQGQRIVVSERDPWAMRGYELYGEVARSVGLTWGGGWRSLRDYGHVELRHRGVLRARSD